MLISCGIQWLAQVARYFSQAHLYLNGTSWLTSVWPLMMRLSAALTRRPPPSLRAATGDTGCAGVHGTTDCSRGCGVMRAVSSLQFNMIFPMLRLWEQHDEMQSIRAR
jgi:hypothetical protein